jgi:hypothetical protein
MNEHEVGELLRRVNAIDVADLPDPRESPEAQRLLASILIVAPSRVEDASLGQQPRLIADVSKTGLQPQQRRSRRTALLVAVLLVLLLAAVIVAAVSIGSSNPRPAAFDRPAGARDVMPSSLADYLNLRPGETRKIGSWTDSEGVVRDLFVTTAAGLPGSTKPRPLTCLLLSSSGVAGGGCNPASDFFAGRSLVWTESSEPDPSGETHSFIVGVATPAVMTVRVLDSVGKTTDLKVNRDGGFLYEVTPTLRGAGIEPVRLTAIDDAGTPIDQVSLK